MLKLFFVQAFLLRLFWHHNWNPTSLQISTFFDRAVTIKIKYSYILPDVVDQPQRKSELQHLTLLRNNLHFQTPTFCWQTSLLQQGISRQKCEFRKTWWFLIHSSKDLRSDVREQNFSYPMMMCEKCGKKGTYPFLLLVYTTYVRVLRYSPAPELLGRLETIFQQQKYSFEKPILKSVKRFLL